MRHFAICVALLFIASSSAFAQQSVGFSNPDNIYSILDYRLPAWGYSNFYLDFDAQANGSDQKSTFSDNARRQGSFMVRPTYDLYRESEARIFRFNTGVDLTFLNGVDKSSNDFSSSDAKVQSQNFESNFDISTSLREYVTDRSFLYADGRFRFTYESNKNERRENDVLIDKRLNYDRGISFNPRIGYGFGRVRNVGAVIRAVRLAERLDALPAEVNMDDEDILSAADQFTRYDGYQQTYDRPEKHFWGDMDDMTRADLGALESFNMLYLTDVLDEAIGQRLEGWEVYGGAKLNYDNNLMRTETPLNPPSLDSRNQFVNKSVGAFVNSRWYTNTSLQQQWGGIGNVSLQYPLGDQNSVSAERVVRLETGINWLWNITDRFLADAALWNIYSRTKYSGASIGGMSADYSEWNNNLYLVTNFSYFIENSLSLTFLVDAALRHRGDTQTDQTLNNRVFNWGTTLGLRYYFNRNLY